MAKKKIVRLKKGETKQVKLTYNEQVVITLALERSLKTFDFGMKQTATSLLKQLRELVSK